MAVTPNVVSLQNMEVGVAGPDGANTMFITTGLAKASLFISSGSRKENFAVHVGPSLTVGQFRRSIATASLAEIEFRDFSPPQTDRMRWEIEDVDADFDDEANRIELRFTLEIETSSGSQTLLRTVSFTVTTLAEM